jgi:Nucleotidyl transferase AbiEii toxin, Type IV TA system
MPLDYLHNHPEFADLIRIVAEEKGIDPALVENDYWIMHCLYGLQRLGLKFELKGGTSLSKGYQIIDRFSEDSWDWKAGVVDDPGLDRPLPIDRGQHHLPHLLVRPAPFADEMQQRLMLRRRPLRCRYRRHRLNALAFAGHHQPQAIIS